MNAALDRILGVPRSSHARFGGVLLVALLSHLVVGFAAASAKRAASAPPPEMEMEALPPEPPLPEPPPPEPPPPVPEPEPSPEKVASPAAAPNDPPSAPPPAAAANVMTAPDDAPVDMTGGMVVGSAETYAGGTVSASSTLTRVGSSGRAAGSGPGSTGTAPSSTPPPKGPDLSRAARLPDGQSWSCPFPGEADEKGIDSAVVGLAIEVSAEGEVESVSVERDPGNGFGRVAAACARSKRFSPAEDRDGKRVHGRSRVNVRFQR